MLVGAQARTSGLDGKIGICMEVVLSTSHRTFAPCWVHNPSGTGWIRFTTRTISRNGVPWARPPTKAPERLRGKSNRGGGPGIRITGDLEVGESRGGFVHLDARARGTAEGPRCAFSVELRKYGDGMGDWAFFGRPRSL